MKFILANVSKLIENDELSVNLLQSTSNNYHVWVQQGKLAEAIVRIKNNRGSIFIYGKVD